MGNGLTVSKELWGMKQRQLDEWRKANPSDDGSPWYKNIFERIVFMTGARVLDVGAMDGRLKKCLPPDIDYTGIDPNGEGSVINGMAEALPFEDDSFDYVMCFASLFHFMDLKRSFSEMNRVLREGGYLMVLVILKGKKDMDSPSHTFRLTDEIMDDLAGEVKLRLISKERIEDLNSWLYRWVK
jgi:ubiquinone/menaquinone biosynthesis C-methylase UbiE